MRTHPIFHILCLSLLLPLGAQGQTLPVEWGHGWNVSLDSSAHTIQRTDPADSIGGLKSRQRLHRHSDGDLSVVMADTALAGEWRYFAGLQAFGEPPLKDGMRYSYYVRKKPDGGRSIYIKEGGQTIQSLGSWKFNRTYEIIARGSKVHYIMFNTTGSNPADTVWLHTSALPRLGDLDVTLAPASNVPGRLPSSVSVRGFGSPQPLAPFRIPPHMLVDSAGGTFSSGPGTGADGIVMDGTLGAHMDGELRLRVPAPGAHDTLMYAVLLLPVFEPDPGSHAYGMAFLKTGAVSWLSISEDGAGVASLPAPAGAAEYLVKSEGGVLSYHLVGADGGPQPAAQRRGAGGHGPSGDACGLRGGPRPAAGAHGDRGLQPRLRA